MLDRGGIIAGMSAGVAVMGSNMPIGDTAGLANLNSGRENGTGMDLALLAKATVGNHIN